MFGSGPIPCRMPLGLSSLSCPSFHRCVSGLEWAGQSDMSSTKESGAQQTHAPEIALRTIPVMLSVTNEKTTPVISIDRIRLFRLRSDRIARDQWLRSADVRAELRLDRFVVMPNHIHGIVFIDAPKGTGDPPVAPTAVNGPRQRSLGSFIGGYKSAVTTRINRTPVGATGWSPIVRGGYNAPYIREGGP